MAEVARWNLEGVCKTKDIPSPSYIFTLLFVDCVPAFLGIIWPLYLIYDFQGNKIIAHCNCKYLFLLSGYFFILTNFGYEVIFFNCVSSSFTITNILTFIFF